MLNRFVVFFLSLSLIACSGGGGGGKKNETITNIYRLSYKYPINDMGFGDGSREVSPVGAVCVDKKGAEVDASFCPELSNLDLATAPKNTQLSPPGSKSIVIDNSQNGQVEVFFGEGESWSTLDESSKFEKVSGKLACLTGFDITFKGSCEVFSPEFRYGPWPANTLTPCSISRIVTRDHFCRSNITGVDIDINDCSSLVPDNSSIQLSPQGVTLVTLQNGDQVNLFCDEGKGEVDIASGGSSIQSFVSCGEDRHISSSSCVDDTFISNSFIYEDLNLQVGDGVRMSNAIAVETCSRQHNGDSVDPSKCSLPEVIPQRPVSSPEGVMQVNVPYSDVPVSVTVASGQTWDSVPVEEKFEKLKDVISCSSGRLFSKSAECLIPSYTAVLGDVPENDMSACDGKKTVFHNYQCLYNITEQLTSSSNCPNTSAGIEQLSPKGNKQVTLINGDSVVKLCEVGETVSEGVISEYLSCGENRHLYESICTDDVFTIAEFNYADPMLSVGAGSLAVTADGIKRCERDHNNESVDVSLCTPPEPMPEKVFLSPAGETSFINNIGEESIVFVNEGEVPSSSSAFVKSVSCARFRKAENENSRCENIKVVDFGSCSLGRTLFKFEDGTGFSTGGTSSSDNKPLVKSFLEAGNLDKTYCNSSYSYLATNSNKEAIYWTGTTSSTPSAYTNVERVFPQSYGYILVHTNGSMTKVDMGSSYDTVTLPTVSYGQLKDVICLRFDLSNTVTRAGCFIYKTDNKVVLAGPTDFAITFNKSIDVNYNITTSSVVSKKSAIEAGVWNDVKADEFRESVMFLKSDGSVLNVGTLKLTQWGATTNEPAFFATAPTGVVKIFSEEGSWMGVKSDNSIATWGRNNLSVASYPSTTSLAEISLGFPLNGVLYHADKTVSFSNNSYHGNVPQDNYLEVTRVSGTKFLFRKDSSFVYHTGFDIQDISYVDFVKGNGAFIVKQENGTWLGYGNGFGGALSGEFKKVVNPHLP